MENQDIVPENTEGAKTDTESSVKCNSVEEAVLRYQSAKEKLLNVSEWHTYAGDGTADFQLTGRNGEAVWRPAQEGDYFRIDLPALGSETGDGDDWVQIKSITESNDPASKIEQTAIIVNPSPNPKKNSTDTAHFFKNDASSTFIVKRINNTVFAEVHGRNEKPNTEETTSIVDKARNAVVAVGAILGLSKIQWKALVNGLLE